MDARLAEATTRASGNPKRPSGQRSRESEDVLSPEPTPAPRSALHNGKAKILLVDDRPANLLAYQVILEELGEELIMVQSGEEALEQLLTHDFAVILLDVTMPGMDGFETAKAIRERETQAHPDHVPHRL